MLWDTFWIKHQVRIAYGIYFFLPSHPHQTYFCYLIQVYLMTHKSQEHQFMFPLRALRLGVSSSRLVFDGHTIFVFTSFLPTQTFVAFEGLM